jgi:DNA repair exonuclease SbcCD ATPase subunit
MILKSIEYNNFQLFSEARINFEKINAVTGVNLDSPDESANGSGKTTAGISGILFCLYGKVDGINIVDLLRIGEKKASVKTIWEDNGKEIIITRTIPSSLTIIIDGEDFDGNTIALKERYVNEKFGTYEDFRMFRTIDSEQGINLLSLGGTALRKTMMSFIDEECAVWRDKVLDIKSEREKFGKDKRPYKFYLSKKRLEVLKSNQEKFELSIKEAKEEIKKQDILLSDLRIKKSNINQKIESNKNQIKEYQNHIIDLEHKIADYQKSEVNTPIETINKIDYEAQVKAIETNLDLKEKELEEIKIEKEEIITTVQKYILLIAETELSIEHVQNEIEKLEIEIKSLDTLESNSRCDKCGAQVTEENKAGFKKEKLDLIIRKKEGKERITKKLQKVQIDCKNYETSKLEKNKEEKAAEKIISDLRSNIKQLQKLKDTQTEAISNQEKEIAKRKTENDNREISIKEAEKQTGETNDRIKILLEDNRKQEKDLFNINESLEAETDFASVHTSNLEKTEPKQVKIKEYILKLSEAFKFETYKYTQQDIEVCQEAIRTVDAFAGVYIEEWLQQLEIIINDLLRTMNLSIKFLSTKDFIEVYDNGKTLKYGQLSSGQKTFLNAIFKLAILLHKGQNDGIFLADEGFSSMDKVNLSKFITVCNGLNIQVNFIYQNIDRIENVNYINVVRKNGESQIE